MMEEANMSEGKNVIIGILGILLGLIVIVFPLISVFTVNAIAGIGLVFVGIWILLKSLKNESIAAGIAGLIVAVFAIMMGIVFIGDVKAFEFFSFIALYIVAFFLVLAGIESLISGKGLKGKGIGALGIVIGIIFAIIGTFAANPLVLAALIGAFLIIAGIIELIAPEIISPTNVTDDKKGKKVKK
jgi:membrane protein HdeD